MRKTLLLLGLAALTAPAALAQTTLNAGDIQIIQVSADGTKPFSFVPLVALDPGTVINFTDNGWLNTNAFRTGEGTLTWTAPAAGVEAGRVITIDNITGTANTATTNVGTVTNTATFNPSGNGDQIFAYQGTAASPTLLDGVNWANSGWVANATSANNSAQPTALGSNAVHLGNQDNYAYTEPATLDPATLNDPANYTDSDTAPITPTGAGTFLPVELVAFTASANGRSAVLAWTTASETNNAGFTVEQQRGQTWTEASGLIAGHGTTTERQSYSFSVDGLTAGTHVFRLRQTDTDGTVHYSATTSVEIGVEGGLAVTALGARALRVEAQADGTVVVADVLGRRVLAQPVAAGTSVVSLAGVAPGVYLVRAESAGRVATTRLVVR